MTSKPVSVIIPVYNAAPYLAQAIDSVLAQTRPPAEIIVVDDDSTDGSAEIAKSYAPRVCYLHQPNQGPSAARNLGVEQSTGDLLAFLDADDLWLPDKLERQLCVLAADLTREAVLGGAENFISPELDDPQRAVLARAATQTGNYHVGTLLIRRAAFLRVGQFDIRWRQSEFVEWWGRAMRLKLTYTITPAVILCRRLHTNNLTRREKENRREYLAMLREHLAEGRIASVSQNYVAPEEQ